VRSPDPSLPVRKWAGPRDYFDLYTVTLFYEHDLVVNLVNAEWHH